MLLSWSPTYIITIIIAMLQQEQALEFHLQYFTTIRSIIGRTVNNHAPVHFQLC